MDWETELSHDSPATFTAQELIDDLKNRDEYASWRCLIQCINSVLSSDDMFSERLAFAQEILANVDITLTESAYASPLRKELESRLRSHAFDPIDYNKIEFIVNQLKLLESS